MLTTRKQFFVNITIIGILASLLVVCINTNLRLTLFKFLYVRYIRITKSNFSNRVDDLELQTAITHARQQPWVQQQIKADLAPFRAGISTKQIDRWFNEYYKEDNQLAKFIIAKNKVYFELPKTLQSKRSFKTIRDVLTLLANKHMLPDCQFVVTLHDYLANVPLNAPPAAIFTFAKHIQVPVENTTILIPDWMNLRYWDVLDKRIDYAAKVFPWEKKLDFIHWRGGSADSMGHRQKLVDLSAKLNFLDVGLTEGAQATAHIDPEYSIKNKYQIALDGSRCTWERVVWQLHSNSVLIKPNSPQIQWFYRGLTPYQHYVPIKDVNAESLDSIYSWLQNNDETARQISKNANKFAQENLKTADFMAYFVILLEEYAKQQIDNTNV